MIDTPLHSGLSEDDFAAHVETLAATAAADQLADLLREDHAVYDQRSTAAVVRMRGWLLLTLGRIGLPPSALLLVLEELETGHDGYLVAAAARALRSSSPRPEFGPFLMQAIGNMRYRDDAVVLESYGAYATSSDLATPIREVLAALCWLGPHARDVRPDLEALRAPGSGLSRKLLPDLERAIASTASTGPAQPAGACCDWRTGIGSVLRWPLGSRAAADAVRSMVFEDQDGATVSYTDFFVGQPSIVAFFYTRCDNPQKCSLTVAKLARVQRLLAEAGVADRVHTAAITYDPGFDLPPRLRAYGQSRRMRMDGSHRLLRATEGIEPLRRFFSLGVNFIGSLVNRHRIEVYVLDAMGRIAGSFARVHWSERDVVERAVALLGDDRGDHTAAARPSGPPATAGIASSAIGTLASLGVAVFPKCPICWASYMSMLGVSSLVPVPYAPWMQPVLLGVVALNVASVWWRCRVVGRMTGFHLAATGAMAILAATVQWLPESALVFGVISTAAGSVASTWTRPQPHVSLTAST